MSKTAKNLAITFFISGIVATAIDQSFMGYGYRICEVTWQSAEAQSLCEREVKKESKNGFLNNFFIAAVIVLAGLSAVTKREK